MSAPDPTAPTGGSCSAPTTPDDVNAGLDTDDAADPGCAADSRHPAAPVVVLVDDRREFWPPRPGATVLRTAPEAVAVLSRLHHAGVPVAELWLDHDLGRDGTGTEVTVMPVVDWMVREAVTGTAPRIDVVYVHTSSPPGRRDILGALTGPRLAGTWTVRSVDDRAHLRQDPTLPEVQDAPGS